MSCFAGFGDKSWDKSPEPDEKTISSPFSSPGAVFSSLSYCPGPPRFPDYETRRASAASKGPTMRRETVPKEGIMEKSITRRSFLAGSAAVSSIAALGLAGCASSQKTATPTAATGTEGIITPSYPAYARTLDIAENDVIRTEDADIVVVGSGSAGTFAAVRAAERGARVIWLEKTSSKGGTSTITEGLTAFDAEQQRATGEKSDLKGIYTMLMDWHNWGAKTEAFQTYFDFSGKAIDWAISHGANLVYSGNPKKPHYSAVDDQGNWMNIGTGVLAPLWEYGDSLDNLDFRIETPAVNIVVENGAVKGIYAQEADGIVRINAQAVIMATGGFASNVEMAREWLRVPAERIKFISFEGQDGDGINMALAAGASRHAPHDCQLRPYHH